MVKKCLFVVFVALFCNVHSVPFIFEDEVDNTIDELGNFQIDLSYLGNRIFGAPSAKTGDMVANWTPESGLNPEEMGEYAEGDILHPPSEARNGVTRQNARWPGAIIPYIISGSYSQSQIDMIKMAIADFHRLTCVRFVPRKDQTDFLTIGNGKTGCWSSVGLIGGQQEVNLQSPGCVTKKGTVIHELMHALGFLHEQSRPERDNFVSILFQNIKQGDAYNFEKAPKDSVTAFGIPYDYNSVMHYGAYAFSSNSQPTIVPKKSGTVIGQREGLSRDDVAKINAMYNCKNKVPDEGWNEAGVFVGSKK